MKRNRKPEDYEIENRELAELALSGEPGYEHLEGWARLVLQQAAPETEAEEPSQFEISFDTLSAEEPHDALDSERRGTPHAPCLDARKADEVGADCDSDPEGIRG